MPFRQKFSQHTNSFIPFGALQREVEKRVNEFSGIGAMFLEMVVNPALAFVQVNLNTDKFRFSVYLAELLNVLLD
ncbi:MAG: hypothetical protein ACREDS_10335 [Limisphaerales bacterium]